MKETGLRIRVFPDPVLRKKARAVIKVTDSHRETLSAMAQAMYEGQGIGLAAPQVGISEALVVADVGTGLYKLINPVVTEKKGTQSLEEGCLSVPGICISVKRGMKVKIKALDESGNPTQIEADGLLACCLQHEIDHLKGKLIVDYASFLGKIKIKKRLRELEEVKAKSCKLKL